MKIFYQKRRIFNKLYSIKIVIAFYIYLNMPKKKFTEKGFIHSFTKFNIIFWVKVTGETFSYFNRKGAEEARC